MIVCIHMDIKVPHPPEKNKEKKKKKSAVGTNSAVIGQYFPKKNSHDVAENVSLFDTWIIP